MLRVTRKQAMELRKMKKEVVRTKRGYWAVETSKLMARLKSIDGRGENG